MSARWRSAADAAPSESGLGAIVDGDGSADGVGVGVGGALDGAAVSDEDA